MRTSRVGAVAATTVAVALSVALPAASATAAGTGQLHVLRVVSNNDVGPLQFTTDGTDTYVADAFTSTLSEVGHKKPLAYGIGHRGDVAGVALDPATGAVAYTSSDHGHQRTLLTITQPGRVPVVANLARFEAAENPDGAISYGVGNPSACVADALQEAGVPVSYTGVVDSHPYAVASLGDGSWAVADAGGNDLVKVTATGAMSLLSVVPPSAVTSPPSWSASSVSPTAWTV